MTVAALVVYFTVNFVWWPYPGVRARGQSTYLPMPVPEYRQGGVLSVEKKGPGRQVRTESNICAVQGGAVFEGVLKVWVSGPSGREPFAQIDAASGVVLDADPLAGVTVGSILTSQGMRSMYGAAGLDTNASPELAEEADAMFTVVQKEWSAPLEGGGGGVQVRGVTVMGRRDGGMLCDPIGPLLVIGPLCLRVWTVYVPLVIMLYMWLLAIARRRRNAAELVAAAEQRGSVSVV